MIFHFQPLLGSLNQWFSVVDSPVCDYVVEKCRIVEVSGLWWWCLVCWSLARRGAAGAWCSGSRRWPTSSSSAGWTSRGSCDPGSPASPWRRCRGRRWPCSSGGTSTTSVSCMHGNTRVCYRVFLKDGDKVKLLCILKSFCNNLFLVIFLDHLCGHLMI